MAEGGRIGFVALGCPLATVAFERLLGRLHAEGYVITDSADDAELVIVNTCSFSAAVLEPSLDAIDGALDASSRIIVTGCSGGDDDAVIAARPRVRAVIRPPVEDEVMRAVHQHLPPPHESSVVVAAAPHMRLTPPHYAYLNIAADSTQHCSFGFLPPLGGDLPSRPLHELMDEAEALVAAGAKEILVVSQDLAAYGADVQHRTGFWRGRPLKTSLPELARTLGELGIWIRLHSMHSAPVIDELITLMAAGRVLPYLDLSLAHVSPRILQALQRPAAAEHMLARLRKWRGICPDLTIRASFITGFPDETEAEFEDLLDFLRLAQFDRVGVSAYVGASGTVAGEMAEELREQRHMHLLDLQEDISTRRLESKIGRVMTVLVDAIDEQGALARTGADAPEIDGVVLIGDAAGLEVGEFAAVRITDCDVHDLYAEPL